MKKIFPSWNTRPNSLAAPRSQPTSSKTTAAPNSSNPVARQLGQSSLAGTGGKVGFGGKGLGKGGLKRHRKIVRDSIRGITKGDIRRLARRGGVKRISGTIYDDVRQAVTDRLKIILKDCCIMLQHADRKTIAVTDVIFALKRLGKPIYGFDAVKGR